MAPSEVGMVTQVSAIQSVTEPLHRPQSDAGSLPVHLRDLSNWTRRLEISMLRNNAN